MYCCSYKEEANADKAIKALTSALAPKAKVLRDGKVEQIDAVGLVPGEPRTGCSCLKELALGVLFLQS